MAIIDRRVSIPHIAKNVISAVPPLLINGRGIPVVGSSPVLTHILRMNWNPIRVVMRKTRDLS